MTNDSATSANDTPRPNLRDCAYDATILMGLLEAIDHLDNEGHVNAMTSVISTAYKAARRLSDDLEGLESARSSHENRATFSPDGR